MPDTPPVGLMLPLPRSRSADVALAGDIALTADIALTGPAVFGALEQAAGAVARLDQALNNFPLLPAFLYRARLEAVRRQAAVDGHAIDPWHLAATLEGLRLRMDGALRIIDRGAMFAAARVALGHHQWLAAPDPEQESEVQAAERHLADSTCPSALLTAALQVRGWLEAGKTRPPMRAALVRFWMRRGLLRHPVPLTGPLALSADAPDNPAKWICTFLYALAGEASDGHDLLRDLERTWLAARRKTAGRRSTSRAGLAIDVLAAAPLMSATTLARAIGMSIKGATELLDGFVAEEIAVEVTHRSARRLFGLHGLAPLRDATTAPRRPVPGRTRGRPRRTDAADPVEAPPPLPSPGRFERPVIDYAALDAAMAQCNDTIRSARRALDGLALNGLALNGLGRSGDSAAKTGS